MKRVRLLLQRMQIEVSIDDRTHVSLDAYLLERDATAMHELARGPVIMVAEPDSGDAILMVSCREGRFACDAVIGSVPQQPVEFEDELETVDYFQSVIEALNA